MQTPLSMFRVAVFVAAGAVALAFPATSTAALISFDQIGGVEGQVTNVDGEDFIGTNIRFDQINFEGTTVFCDSTGLANSDADACWLNFNTATGEFVVTADSGLYDIDGNLLPGLDDGEVTVLTGTGFSFVGLAGTTTLVIEGTDEKLAELLVYFGIEEDNWIFSNTEIKNPGGFPVGQTVSVTSADLDNASDDDNPGEQIPEPGLLALFGIGLLGVGRQMARRRKKE